MPRYGGAPTGRRRRASYTAIPGLPANPELPANPGLPPFQRRPHPAPLPGRTMLLLLTSLSALAAEPLNFTPDRRGIGESTETVGVGHLMVEGGLGLTVPMGSGPAAVQTVQWTARVGVDQGLELRLRVPDIVYDGGATVGSVGLGAKFGGSMGERWSVSAVPEVAYDLAANAVSGSINTNLALDVELLTVWMHTSFAFQQITTAVVGGGAAITFEPLGVYVNAGLPSGAIPFVGAGAWWLVEPAVQVDVGLDLTLESAPTLLLTVGVSLGV